MWTPYDDTAANVASLIGSGVLIVGILLLAIQGFRQAREDTMSMRSTRLLIAAFVVVEVGLAFNITAMWIDGGTWLPGLIAATVAWAGSIGLLIWAGRAMVRRFREQPPQHN
jgi:hypothetical protein